jgi:hypothetical protein
VSIGVASPSATGSTEPERATEQLDDPSMSRLDALGDQDGGAV